MVPIHKDPVVVREVAVLVDQFMITHMVMIVMIRIAGTMRGMEDRLRTPSPAPRPPIRIPLTLAEDETIQHIHILSLPVDCRPEVGKSYDLISKPPDEEEHCNGNDEQPVHFRSWNRG